jgi:peptidyl-prolyl cis-trans isomerase SurA
VRSKVLHVCTAALALGLMTCVPAYAGAQENRQVVDEVVAQVNDDIITLSRLKSESKRRVEALRDLGMTEAQALDEVTRHREELLTALINDQLLMQKGKELDLSEKVEGEVNQRLAEVATHQENTTNKQLNEEVRAALRMQIMKQVVFEQEVDSKLFAGFSLAELHGYFDAHQEKFRKSETVTLSEIFLSIAGKSEAEVKMKAEQLVSQLRAGADFGKLAAANSEREEKGKRLGPTTNGKVGVFALPSLREDIATTIKNLKVGAISEPLKTDDGYQILRVDARTPAGRESVFNQNRVRELMTIELSPKAHEEYMKFLRDEAYIAIAKDYQNGAAAPR